MSTNWNSAVSPTVLGAVVFGAFFVCVTAVLMAAASTGSILGFITGLALLSFILMIGAQVLVGTLLRRRQRIKEKIRSAGRRMRSRDTEA